MPPTARKAKILLKYGFISEAREVLSVIELSEDPEIPESEKELVRQIRE